MHQIAPFFILKLLTLPAGPLPTGPVPCPCQILDTLPRSVCILSTLKFNNLYVTCRKSINLNSRGVPRIWEVGQEFVFQI